MQESINDLEASGDWIPIEIVDDDTDPTQDLTQDLAQANLIFNFIYKGFNKIYLGTKPVICGK